VARFDNGRSSKIPRKRLTTEQIIGKLYEKVTDFTIVGRSPLALTRYYNSAAGIPGGSFGNWRSTYDRSLSIDPSGVDASRTVVGRLPICTSIDVLRVVASLIMRATRRVRSRPHCVASTPISIHQILLRPNSDSLSGCVSSMSIEAPFRFHRDLFELQNHVGLPPPSATPTWA
jgi:Domain of unknown function (DUF6531)